VSSAEIAAGRIHYQLAADGPAAVLTPGGRLALADVDLLAARLRSRLRLLEWDRRNTGASDLYLGKASEQNRWADDLAELLRQLDLAPAWLLGGSAGARVSYLTAVRHPEVVRGLVLWSVSGGPYASQFLGFNYHVPYITAALAGGMAAVAATPFYAERIAANPANAEALRGTDPGAFVEAMLEWNEDFVPRPDMPAIAVTGTQLTTIRVPTLIFDGNDLIHPPSASRDVHQLIAGSMLVPSGWSGEEFTDRQVGKVREPVMALYPRLTDTMLQFIESDGRGLPS
jgi:pimeloyl-ACP methyl ester carboxylesterase